MSGTQPQPGALGSSAVGSVSTLCLLGGRPPGGTYTRQSGPRKTAPSLFASLGETQPPCLQAKPCKDCGQPIPHEGVGRPRERCETCRGLMRLSPKACEYCGIRFTPDAAHWKTRRWCSPVCRLASNLAAANAAYRVLVQNYDLACAHCGVTFQATSARGATFRRFCSQGCKRRYHFAKKYGAANYQARPSVSIGRRRALFDRDNWRCGICGAVIDRALAWPHPGSASLDHVVPLVDGGPHEPGNWQAAHLACNIEKGNARRSA